MLGILPTTSGKRVLRAKSVSAPPLEKLSKPKISEDFMRFWLCRFRKLDVKQKSHRKMLIDTFINAVFLYDDKLVITYNFKEGTKTITFGDLKEAENKGVGGSDLDSSATFFHSEINQRIRTVSVW